MKSHFFRGSFSQPTFNREWVGEPDYIFVAKICKCGIFVAKICKYGIVVAKIYKYALIDSFQGSAGSLESAANCAALPNSISVCISWLEPPKGAEDEVKRLLVVNIICSVTW